MIIAIYACTSLAWCSTHTMMVPAEQITLQDSSAMASLVNRCRVALEVRRQRLREVAYGKGGYSEAAE